jgi:carbonic anhydrase
MKKLIRGIVDFRKNVRPSYKDTFARLALGQAADTLFVACSDSRVVPNLFASSEPGDLFVIRNVGNLIPPCGEGDTSNCDESEAAAIEFALLSLPVSQIIVCGHSECGAMAALSQGRDKVAAPNLKSWLRHGDATLRQLEKGSCLGAHLERHNQVSQLNVLKQMEHLETYPLVQERLKQGTLKIHGWWFDIKEAEVSEYEPDEGCFRVIDEEYAKVLIDRAGTVPPVG